MEKTIKSSAPGKMILFGEHSVLYNKLGIAAAINKRSYARVSKAANLTVNAIDFKIKKTIGKKDLFGFLEKIKKLRNDKEFDIIQAIAKDKLSAIFAVVANAIDNKYMGMNIDVWSEVPENLGSSSSVFSSVATAILKFLDKETIPEKISSLAYEGDVIAHGILPSGIDSTTCSYGGFIQYKKTSGAKSIKLNFDFPMLVVNSMESVPTYKTVSRIRNLHEKNSKFVEEIMDSLDSIAYQGLDAINSENLENIGKAMNYFYHKLKKLGISTERLDEIVKHAVKQGAFGAKPTGSWGGGCCIILPRDRNQAEKLKNFYNNAGFKSFFTEIGTEGARIESK